MTLGCRLSNLVLVASMLCLLTMQHVSADDVSPKPVRLVFLIFYDWRSDIITKEGLDVVMQALGAWKSAHPPSINITGYTDTSLSNQESVDLSKNMLKMFLMC